MKFFDLTGEITSELRLTRIALQSIAKSLESLVAIPEAPPLPDKPAGVEALGEYGVGLNTLEGEDAEYIRQRLRQDGLTDRDVEDSLVSFLTGESGTEESF